MDDSEDVYQYAVAAGSWVPFDSELSFEVMMGCERVMYFVDQIQMIEIHCDVKL